MIYDLIIVGAGPAGLSAALTACYLRLKHLVLEAGEAGGVPVHVYPWKEVDSFIGFFGVSGKGVAERMTSHARKEGAVIHEGERMTGIKRDGKKRTFKVRTDKGVYETKAVLFASGTSGTPRKLGIPGEDNPNIQYSIADPEHYRGKNVLIVGGGDTALESALVLDKANAKVYLAHRKGEFRAMNKTQEEIKRSSVEVLFDTEVKEIAGKEKIEKVKVMNNKTNKERILEVDNIVVCIGSVFSLDFLKSLGVKTEEDKILVDDEMRTNVEGFYAAGDVTGRLKRIPEAIGEGHLAVYSIFKWLKKPYWV
ncbi:FAD-dependent oxidoreductase [Candidatus Micrarchaeota archaeon]|nr:FAD-dependent oxidoreductase [Candidatus Micrarchaeota archaeon]